MFRGYFLGFVTAYYNISIVNRMCDGGVVGVGGDDGVGGVGGLAVLAVLMKV